MNSIVSHFQNPATQEVLNLVFRHKWEKNCHLNSHQLITIYII